MRGRGSLPIDRQSIGSASPRSARSLGSRPREGSVTFAEDTTSPGQEAIAQPPSFDMNSPDRRGSVGSRGSVGRRGSSAGSARTPSRKGSLATQAFQQAMDNRKYRERTDDEMDAIAKDSEDIEGFLRRRQSWKEGCGHHIAMFASQIREACGAKKAADKFLNKALGRGLAKKEDDPAQALANSLNGGPQHLSWGHFAGPSAILEWAASNETAKTHDRSNAYSVTKPVTTAVLPSAVRQSPEKRGERNGMIRRFRPGTSENTNMSTPPKELRAKTPLSTGHGAVSGQSPANKYPQLCSPRQEGKKVVTAKATWEKQARCGKGRKAMAHFPRQQDQVTLITGSVDYGSLLQDQREQQSRLADHNAKYEELMTRYDEINYLNQRKLSRLLKPGVGLGINEFEDRMGAPERKKLPPLASSPEHGQSPQ